MGSDAVWHCGVILRRMGHVGCVEYGNGLAHTLFSLAEVEAIAVTEPIGLKRFEARSVVQRHICHPGEGGQRELIAK